MIKPICHFCQQPITYPRGISNYEKPVSKFIWPVPFESDITTGKTACPKCAVKQEQLQLELGLIVTE